MKKIVNVTEVDGEGLLGLLGSRVLLLCMNYFYTGILEGVNETDVLLSDAAIVYETGRWTDNTFKDAQKVNRPLHVRIPTIESYMAVEL